MPDCPRAALKDYAHAAYPKPRIHFFHAATQGKSRAWFIWSGSYAMHIRAEAFCRRKLCEQAFIHSFHRVIHSFAVHQPRKIGMLPILSTISTDYPQASSTAAAHVEKPSVTSEDVILQRAYSWISLPVLYVYAFS